MTKYNVGGMTCASCSARVEKAVNCVEGVKSCAVNLLTNSMTVEGNVDPARIIKAVENAGYNAELADDSEKADEFKDNNTKKIIKRLIASVVFLIPLMYISMGNIMWGWWLPHIIDDKPMVKGIIEMIFSLIIICINAKFFVNGTRGIINKAPNMDTLVSMGSGASFIYSVVSLVNLGMCVHNNEIENATHYLHNLYFESAAMILVLITVGKTLESYSKGKTTNALNSLMNLTPKTATVIIEGVEKSVLVSDIKVGDILIAKPGESIAVDGVVTEGNSTVDESVLTGESIPVDKQPGSSVSSGTINGNGVLVYKAERVGESTTISQIIKMVADASATKAPISKIADKVSGIFVPVVIAISAVTLVIWLLSGAEWGYSLSRAISVLVISCPCSLGLATPVAIMVGSGIGAKHGILFKTAASLEEAGRVDIIALDKTGTVTTGLPEVTDIIPLSEMSEADLLSFAYSVEKFSEHPLARAIIDYCAEKNIKSFEVSDFKALTGCGVEGNIGDSHFIAGSYKYIKSIAEISQETKCRIEKLSDEGKTPLVFSKDKIVIGIIAVADTIKQDSEKAIASLKKLGINVVMLTGDNSRTAKAIAGKAGIDEVFSELLPADKERIIRKLQAYGKVAMVGDGINDAPALTGANIGIAVNAGSDIAIDSADVVIMNSKISDVVSAINLSRQTLVNIKENLFWAFIYNVIGIPFAAGALIGITGITLSPMLAAGAMSLSSVCVVCNALRLNLFDPRRVKTKRENKIINIDIQEEKIMKKEFNVEGMMCHNCENHVVKALSAIDGVETVTASHEAKKVVVELSKDVADDIIIDAIAEEGYKVI